MQRSLALERYSPSTIVWQCFRDLLVAILAAHRLLIDCSIERKSLVNTSSLGHVEQFFAVGIYPVAVMLLQLEAVTVLQVHQQRLQEVQRTLE